jgi:hypothetical protein
MKYLTLFSAVVLLFACSSQFPELEKPVLKKIELEPLPGWIYELPANGNYVIGISARNYDSESMQEAARQMAAIIKSRNRGSYAIDRYARTSGSDLLKEGNILFQLNVSEPDETLKIYDSLNLIDETYLFDHYIALFSETEATIDQFYCQKRILNFPDWYKRDEIVIENDQILCYAQDSSYNLVTAWEKTAEKARYQLAGYLEKNVQGKIISKNEEIEKQIAVESSQKLVNLEITKSFILMKNYDSLISYQVFMEMRTKI